MTESEQPKVREKEKCEKEVDEASGFRRVLPQILACSANNLILFDNSLVLSFPTIVVAALLNSGESLSFTEEESSWFASISYLCQPVGSLFSGMCMEPLGRKKAMLLLNIPFFIGWTLMYFADSVPLLYLGGAIMGFSVGCTEAPILTFVGEISEPKHRGTLTSYAQFCGSLGYFVVYLLGSYYSWRITAACCACVPILTVLAITQVPETPLWLLSRGRVEDAEKALAWLRGWVPVEQIRSELDEMVSYQNHVEVKPTTESREILVPEGSQWRYRITDFFRAELRRPLTLIIVYFFFWYASGLQTFRPYFSVVFEELGLSVSSDEGSVLVALTGILGYGMCVITVHKLGKRKLTFISLIGCAFSTLVMALVAFGVVPTGVWPLIAVLSLSFFTSIGVAPIPWMLQSELYPFRGKCMAAGVGAAASYLIGFVATKTYLSLEDVLTLGGVQLLFTCLSFVGVVVLYFKLPETEGRSFEEISLKFK